MDISPSAVGVSVLAYIGTKDLVQKILGPTADYIGNELKSYTEKGVLNLKRIFDQAEIKLGNEIERPGQVSPKVLKEILDEGYFAEDELAVEYFGGVLASSRTGVKRDDRGAAFVKLIARLSVYQLRVHHFVYMLIRNVYVNSDVNVYIQSECMNKLWIYISFEDYEEFMDFSEEEDGGLLVGHILHGLVREGLIQDSFSYGKFDHVSKTKAITVEKDGMWVAPTALGFELILWAYGKGNLSLNDFFSETLSLKPLDGVRYPIPAAFFKKQA